MLPKIIFCTAVSLATLAVILLAIFSPVVTHRNPAKNPTRPWMALSLYLQQTKDVSTSNTHTVAVPSDAGALIFHRALTEGLENTSRVVGKAQGFIILHSMLSISRLIRVNIGVVLVFRPRILDIRTKMSSLLLGGLALLRLLADLLFLQRQAMAMARRRVLIQMQVTTLNSTSSSLIHLNEDDGDEVMIIVIDYCTW